MRWFNVSLVTLISVIVLAPPGASAEQGGLGNRVAQLEARVAALEEILRFVRVESEPINGLAGPHWIFEGANVHVRSGSGETNDGCNHPDCKSTGLGNLIVGYNELSPAADRTGSHNLVVGPSHSYSSSGGFVAGFGNRVLGLYASVSGGLKNVARGTVSSVSGGSDNEASGVFSSVSGGFRNEASGSTSSVSGGTRNEASGLLYSSVSGGRGNEASGTGSSVSGGFGNVARGPWSTVSGGENRTALGGFNWAAGSLLEED